MRISLGSNIAALQAVQQMNRNSSAFERSLERLSSGMKINRASDDAAGLAIAMALGKDSRVYGQALRNANDGISALNIAGESLRSANDVLVRLKELATQSANGALSRTQRQSIDKESQELTAEFNRQIGSVDFNGLKLLNGSLGRMTIQVGYGTSGTIGFNLGSDLSRNVASSYNAFSTFAAASSTAGSPQAVDMNGDGKLDVVSADILTNEVNVMLGNGDGTFQARTALSFTDVGGLAINDLDGDGKLDIVTGDTSNFYIRYGAGNGTFGSQVTVAAGGSATNQVAIGDLNGDGILDLIGGANSSNVQVVYGLGGRSYSAGIGVSVGVSARGLQIVDVNDDGRDDIVAKDSVTSTAAVTLSAGDSSFGPAVQYAGMGGANGLQVVDIDYDGIKDLITNSSTQINIARGNGDGTFGAVSTLTVAGVTSGLRVEDIDGDGVTDIGALGTSLQIFYGIGDGTFQTVSSYGGPGNTTNLQFGDFNGDGVKDALGRALLNSSVAISFANARSTTNIQRIDLTSKSAALEALGTIDRAMERVSKELGGIGATQSRISSALGTLSAARENSLAAQSRIIDADVGTESANLVRQQILMQTTSAVLAQANQIPGLALLLLG